MWRGQWLSKSQSDFWNTWIQFFRRVIVLVESIHLAGFPDFKTYFPRNIVTFMVRLPAPMYRLQVTPSPIQNMSPRSTHLIKFGTRMKLGAISPCVRTEQCQKTHRRPWEGIDLLLSLIVSGLEKFPLMLICSSKQPRIFNKNTGSDLGFDYWQKSKAWITSSLLFKWFLRFYLYISSTPNRNVFQLLENFQHMDTLPHFLLYISFRLSFCLWTQPLFYSPRTRVSLHHLKEGMVYRRTIVRST